MSEKLSIIYDHYKDTCSMIGEGVKRRDRLMLFVVLVLGFFSLQTVFPAVSDTAVNDFLQSNIGPNFRLELPVIGNIIWFLLLILTLRYFQVAAFVERQYPYIHRVEEELNKHIGENIITREGKAYLQKYPAFSNWMWFLYAITFPTLLFVVSAAKILSEARATWTNGWSFSLLLDAIAFALLTTSIILYLVQLHKKTK